MSAEPQPADRPRAAAGSVASRPAVAGGDGSARPASVSTHVLDTSAGRPAAGIAVDLAVRSGPDTPWAPHAGSTTDADGRCADLPPLPAHTTHVRLRFAVEPYLTDRAAAAHGAPGADSGVFFPEVATVFAVAPGEHYHVPLLLNPFGYSVYRGS